jgi:hypothetical protein
MRTLGFKARHSEGNLETPWRSFGVAEDHVRGGPECPRRFIWVSRWYQWIRWNGRRWTGGKSNFVNPGRLDRAARQPSVGSEDLTEILMTRLGYVKKDIVTAYLDAKGAGRQRDRLVGGLYTLLFASIIDAGNHKLNPEYAGVDSNGAPSVRLD